MSGRVAAAAPRPQQCGDEQQGQFPPDPTALRNKVVAGGHLRSRYGRSYISIGTVSHRGKILGGWERGQPSVCTVPPPGRAMIDHVLGTAKHPGYLLDLWAKAPEQVRNRLDAPAAMRIIGTAYDEKKDADYMTIRLLSLDSSAPTAMLPDLQTAQAVRSSRAPSAVHRP